MSINGPSSDAATDFIRQVLARDSEVRDDIVARIESERFVDVLGRRSTAARARRVIAEAESTTSRSSFPDAAAHAVTLFDIRPSLLVRDDSFELPASPVWRDRLIEAEAVIRRAIPSVGRIDTKNHPHPRIAELAHIGNAWMISENVAVTNRHVAQAFGIRSGQDIQFWSDEMSVCIDFMVDRGDRDTRGFRVARILEIAEDNDADIAFLQFDAHPELPQPLVLDEHYEDEFIVTVGYPAWDPTIPPEIVRHILNDVYDAKRLAPGRIVDAGTENFLRHDASTLKGSSGSVVLSLESGHAVGLQISSSFNSESRALTSARLKDRLSALTLLVPVPATPSMRSPDQNGAASSGRPEDPDGYDPAFLGADFTIPLPGLDSPEARVTTGGGTELAYNHFSIVMHEARRLAICAACNIDGSRLRRIPRTGGFKLDGRLAAEHQWDDGLYRHNPYDREQLVGRSSPVWGDRVTAGKANDDAYFTTNTVPQHIQLNKKIWSGLEDHFLDNADALESRLSVYSGCVFDRADPSYRGARIPREFWKIISYVTAGDDGPVLRSSGFLLDQSPWVRDVQESFAFSAFKTYQLPIREIARRAGLALDVLSRTDALGAEGEVRQRPIPQFSDIVL